MLRSIVSFMIILLCCCVSSAQSLKDYRWKNRLIFIVDPDIEPDGAHPQITAFEGQAKALRERDIIIYILKDNKVLDLEGQLVDWSGETIRDSSFEGIILIGKDGGIKLKESFSLTAREVFDVIDRMPMRREEMKDSVKD